MATTWTSDELAALQCLRASRYSREGPPHFEVPVAHHLCSAIRKALPGCDKLRDVQEKLITAPGETRVAVNSRALREAYLYYAKPDIRLLPAQPKSFYKGRRTLESVFYEASEASTASRAEASNCLEKLKELCRNGKLTPRKGGVELTVEVTPVLPIEPNTTAIVKVSVRNTSTTARVVREWNVLRRPKEETELEDECGLIDTTSRGAPLPPGGCRVLTVHYRPRDFGIAPCLLVVSMGDFQVGQVLQLQCASQYVQDEQAKLRPYVPRSHEALPSEVDTTGEPPERRGPKYRTRLDLEKYRAPPLADLEALWEDSKAAYTAENYASLQHCLWHMEEHKTRDDLRTFAMKKARMNISDGGSFLVLTVPGLAERRPSVLKGDKLKVRNANGRMHAGFVHKVLRDNLFLKFSHSFHQAHLPGALNDVEFLLKVVDFAKRHTAIDEAAKLLLPLIIPSHPSFNMAVPELPELLPNAPRAFNPLNKQLNDQQLRAVTAILQRPPGLPPFVVFGPPGTGKTSTLVEAIVQVFTSKPKARILVCAPSNAATDILLVRVVKALGAKAEKKVVFRANAAFRERSSADAPEVMDYSLYDEKEEVFKLHESFAGFRIVFSTLAFARTVIDVENGFDNLSYVFVDEAGHADEAETLLGMGILSTYRKSLDFCVVLAGDPYQLGPIIHNTKAAPVLGISLLERLMKSPPYVDRIAAQPAQNNDDDVEFKEHDADYHSGYIVKLCNNYRSHAELLKVPAALFYDHFLKPCASDMIQQRFVGWDQLPNPNIPVCFYGVRGRHQQEEDSPSYLNLDEIATVGMVVTAVLEHSGTGVNARDIGIISPYLCQCERIRKMLSTRGRGQSEIKVGTVEAFQGDERAVIIMSTVRSDVSGDASLNGPSLDDAAIGSFLRFDARHNIGFLNNPKRFNVAITRAQSLLVVVGNPFVLQCDRTWRALLDFCTKHKCYKGLAYTAQSQVDEAVEFTELFSSLNLGAAYQAMSEETSAGQQTQADVDSNLPYNREH